jgi:hypothetical protein
MSRTDGLPLRRKGFRGPVEIGIPLKRPVNLFRVIRGGKNKEDYSDTYERKREI